MTLSSSLTAGVAGLGANANKLATISDNIANAGTYGYKRVDTEFTSMVVGANAGAYTAGGVTSTSSRNIGQQGALATTGNALDLAVVGGGFLPVTSASRAAAGAPTQLQLAPTGSFSPDSTGLLRTASGLALLGWPVDETGATIAGSRQSAAGLQPVVVPANAIAAEPTTQITLGANLPAEDTSDSGSGDALPVTIEYFDNLGGSRDLTATFTPSVPAAGSPPTNAWRLSFADSATSGGPVAEYDITFSDAAGLGGTLASVAPVGGAAWNGPDGIADIPIAGGSIAVSLGPVGAESPLTQLAAPFTPTGISKNGAGAGQLTGLEFDAQGFLVGTYDTGLTRNLFQVPLVDVPNPDGLRPEDAGAFSVTGDSGAFFLWDSADGPVGELTGFALEQSTTDIAGELTALIETQRAYSSNAKVIQTVDEMLQETTNIKR
ncbi:MAG: flagellar hook-basal body complex protein [Pseudomonadota bacterium]